MNAQVDHAKLQGTLAEFITNNGLSMAVRTRKANPNMASDTYMTRHFTCTIKTSDGLAMNIPFSQGTAHTKPPTLEDVLDCLASDASGVKNSRSFEDWAGDYGYDTDSRKAEKIYQTCMKQAAELQQLLGHDAYKTLLWDTERL